MSMDLDDRCWGIIIELQDAGISGRLDYMSDGSPMVRVILDEYLFIDCQIDMSEQLPYTIYLRRYGLGDEGVVSEQMQYQATIWQQASKCIELAHRVHEVQICDDMERLEHALDSM